MILPPEAPTRDSDYNFIPLTTSNKRVRHAHSSSVPLIADNLQGSDRSFEKTKKEFRDLRRDYKDWREKFKQVASLFSHFLAGCEYLSNNKENISSVFSIYQIGEEENKGVIEKLDSYYKWINCIIPLSLNFFRYGFASNAEERLKTLPNTPQRHHCSVISESSSGYNETEDYTFEHIKYLFQTKLDGHIEEARDKFIVGLTNLTTKAFGSALHNLKLSHKKEAEKVGKCAYTFFTNFWTLAKFQNLRLLQREWNLLLKPRSFFIGNQSIDNEDVWGLRQLFSEDSKNEEDTPSAGINTEAPTEELLKEKLLDEQVNLSIEFDSFWDTLKNSQEIEEVHSLFLKHGFLFTPPKTIQELHLNLGNEYYKSELAQSFFSYAGRSIIADGDEITNLLAQSEGAFNSKVTKAFRVIARLCLNKINGNEEGLSKEEAEAFFSKLGITSPYKFLESRAGSLPFFPLPNSPLLAWTEASRDQNYINLISKEWVLHQEATSQLIVQGLRQALLCKNELENKFLVFEAIKNSIKIFNSALQLALLLPLHITAPLRLTLEILFKDFSKTSTFRLFNLGTPLYADFKLKIDSIFLMIAKHIFAVNYKPNEYSLEGYILEGKRRMIRFVLLLYSLKFLCQEGLLWVSFKILNMFYQRMQSRSFYEDPSYLALDHQREETKKLWKEYEELVDHQLHKLNLQDLNVLFETPSSRSQVSGNNSEGNKTIDTIVEELMNSDVTFFPRTTIAFFETHLGFKLTEQSKGSLKKYLEDFFTKEEGDFITSFSTNRFKYLKR